MIKDGLFDKATDQLKHAYNDTLQERIPDELMALIAKLETITRGRIK